MKENDALVRPDGHDPSVSRRKFLGMAGAASVALGAAPLLGRAASASPTRTNATRSGSTTKASITVAYLGLNFTPQILHNVAARFEKSNPEIKVTYVPYQASDINGFLTKLLTQIAIGNAPDLINIATEGVQVLTGKGLVSPIDDLVMRDRAEIKSYFSDVHPALIESMMYEGDLYGLPTDFNAADMALDLRLLDEAGLSYPADGWTKDDFYNYAQKIAKLPGSPSGFSWVNRDWGGLVPWLFANGTDLLVEKRYPGGEAIWDTFYAGNKANRAGGWNWPAPQADDPRCVEALEFLVELSKQGLAPQASSSGVYGANVYGLFASGKTGMIPGGGFLSGVLQESGMAPYTWDVQYFPAWRIQRHQFGSVSYLLSNTSKQRDAAWEYMKYLVSTECADILFAENTTTPARRSLFTPARFAKQGPKHWNVYYETFDKFSNTAPIPAPAQNLEIWAATVDSVSSAISGQQSAKAALSSLQGQLETLMK